MAYGFTMNFTMKYCTATKVYPNKIGIQVVWQKVQKISVQFLFRRMFACSIKHCCIGPIKTSSYSFKEPFIPACKEFHQHV